MSGSSQKNNAEQAKADDAFWLTDLYPDAKALLTHEHVPLSDLDNDYIVVLDANVLLLPFETTSQSMDAIGKVYKELAESGKLIVPGQVVREFYKKRSEKIGEIVNKITTAINNSNIQIFQNPIPILEKNQNYKEVKEISKEITSKGKQIEEKLSIIIKDLKDNIGADPVSILYRKYLTDCICELNIEKSERIEIVKEFEKRKRFQIGPGYKDDKKEDGGIGDYLIWRTILQEAKIRQKHCIFVTEESKADWWVKQKLPIQPRPELISEYREVSGGKSLYLLPLSALLKKFNAERKAVEQVQKLEQTLNALEKINFNSLNENIRKSSRKDQHILLVQKINLENRAKRLNMEIKDIFERLSNSKGQGPIILDDGTMAPTNEVLSEKMLLLRETVKEIDSLNQSLGF
ncbi:hypothetical protein BJI49_11920 [Acetobacter pasteurianus]|uniref:PIN domain-containing protein n=1 Tax=Acetobacter pasteurianus TaxID=438 RepID=UPI0002DFA2A0|nr:PIN domain-containing protein [Acetobacter pasteurianus]RCL04901.1 hypothetical protein BJI49_11920 [Acetobacter pasteurianus]GCD49805.1 hypothetical protein NBRC106471_1361 [Acetobacter pasteurianus subsp. pasteurianus LMG 1262 = NBRC 106471]